MNRKGRGKKGNDGPIEQRLTGLRGLMEKKKLDCFLTFSMENVRYLTGFTGSAGMVVVTPRKAYFMTDGRYTTQARQEIKGYVIKQYKVPFKEAGRLINSLSVTRLGIESEHITHASYRALRPQLNVSIVRSTGGMVEELRMVKDADEIRLLKGAADIVGKALEDVMSAIRPGMSEWDIAVELEHRFKLLGSERNSFDFIVASGKRGALPHGIATDKKVRKGEMVTIDCGACWKGYYSDCTRTCVVGRSSLRQREIYQIVHDAQRKAIEAIRPGVKSGAVDAAARKHIAGKGFGKHFTHSTGHGVGLAVHEEPRISQACPVSLEPGMVVTAEPGVYIPEWGGVRIEDMVLVTEDGAEVITSGITSELIAV